MKLCIAALFGVSSVLVAIPAAQDTVEQGGVFEVALRRPGTGNPVIDVRFTARFVQGDNSIEVPGFTTATGSIGCGSCRKSQAPGIKRVKE